MRTTFVSNEAIVSDEAIAARDKAVKIEVLKQAVLIAEKCGNGDQELWEPWESGYRFARTDIAKALNELIEKISLG